MVVTFLVLLIAVSLEPITLVIEGGKYLFNKLLTCCPGTPSPDLGVSVEKMLESGA